MLNLALQLLVNGVVAGGIYTLMALGFTLIYSTLNFFYMAHGAVYALGAYIFFTLVVTAGLPPVAAFPLATGLIALWGLIVNRLAFQPLFARRERAWALVLISIGVAVIMESGIALTLGSEIRTLRGTDAPPSYEFYGLLITGNQILIVVVALVFTVGLQSYLKLSRMGKAIRATADDPEVATVVGVSIKKVYAVAVALGSALAGAAGMLISLETDLAPTMGSLALVKGIVASIIGGVGSIPGAIMGGFLLGVVENLSVIMLPSGWQDALSLGFLLMFLLVRPRGLWMVRLHEERVG